MKLPRLIKPALPLLLFFCSLHPALHAQATKDIPLNNFSEVHITTGIELLISQGNTESARIVTNDYLLDEVVVEQTGNSVNIRWNAHKTTKKAWINRTAKIYLSYKNLNVLEAVDGSSLRTENTLKTDHLDILVSSAGIVTADVNTPALFVKTSSSASAVLSGTAASLKIEASSTSRINAVDLQAEEAKITASSGANLRVNVTKTLETNSNSGSIIRYKGNPELQNYPGAKSGTVQKL